MTSDEYLNYKLKETESRLQKADDEIRVMRVKWVSLLDSITHSHKRDSDATPEQYRLALSDLKAGLKLYHIREDIEQELLLLVDLMPDAYYKWTLGNYSEDRIRRIKKLLEQAAKNHKEKK